MTNQNALLVTVDSLRYDHYRHMRTTRDHLGGSHEHAFSPAGATIGTFPKLFTGRYDAAHAIQPGETFTTEVDARTIGITANRLISERYGYDDGFDHFTSPLTRGDVTLKDKVAGMIPNDADRLFAAASATWSGIQAVTERVRPPAKSFRRATDMVDEFRTATGDDGPWFGWLHFMEPHHPYDPDSADVSRGKAQRLSREAISSDDPEDPDTIRENYRKEVVELDRALSSLWDHIPEDTRVIFTADHGELLGEHGRWGHGMELFPELLHVPFATRNVPVSSPVVSVVDAPALILGREFGRGGLPRDVAFAEGDGTVCAINQDALATPDGARTLHNFRETRDVTLTTQAKQFSPSRVDLSDARKEDLRELGYL